MLELTSQIINYINTTTIITIQILILLVLLYTTLCSINIRWAKNSEQKLEWLHFIDSGCVGNMIITDIFVTSQSTCLSNTVMKTVKVPSTFTAASV